MHKRKTRTIPSPIRRALNSRDRGCRFPGCPNKHYVDGHHIRHWANGGETSLSNLVLLCTFHHRQVHEGGVTIEKLDDGALRFIAKDGRAFDSPRPARPGDEPTTPPADAPQGDWTTPLAAHKAKNIVITPDRCHSLARRIDGLWNRRRSATAPNPTPRTFPRKRVTPMRTKKLSSSCGSKKRQIERAGRNSIGGDAA